MLEKISSRDKRRLAWLGIGMTAIVTGCKLEANVYSQTGKCEPEATICNYDETDELAGLAFLCCGALVTLTISAEWSMAGKEGEA